MEKIGYNLFVLAICIIVHEIGHILYSWIYTKKFPKILFHPYFLMIEVECDENKFDILNKILNHGSGVLLGLLPLLFFEVDVIVVFSYILVCCVDIVAIMALLGIVDKYKISGKTKLIDIPCDRCKSLGLTKLQ